VPVTLYSVGASDAPPQPNAKQHATIAAEEFRKAALVNIKRLRLRKHKNNHDHDLTSTKNMFAFQVEQCFEPDYSLNPSPLHFAWRYYRSYGLLTLFLEDLCCDSLFNDNGDWHLR
jgi:hypothetical protein